jgi:NitT/TauT family transport system ATP-binding protein
MNPRSFGGSKRGNGILALEIIGLTKAFGGKNGDASLHVLEGIHCRVEEGTFVSIVGPSGCGKTTLLRVIAGLETPSSGKVILDGRELSYQTDRIGLVFQEYALFPWLTTLQNIQLGLEIIETPKNQRITAAMDYIRRFGLSGFENRYPRELSGGMQQRVAIARTLITDPKVALMDEPFGSLDSQTRNDLQAFLLKLWETQKVTIIFVTHNVDEAVFLSDDILVLSKRPAKIIGQFQVDCPRPRDRTSSACNAIRKRVLEVLEAEKKGVLF